MAFNAKVGAFNFSTGSTSGTEQITGVGFQPKAIMFWWSGRQSTDPDEAARDNIHRGFGVAASTAGNACMASAEQDGASTSISSHVPASSQCVIEIPTAGAILGRASLASFDADGFTLARDSVFTRKLRTHYLALGGTALTNTTVGSFQASTATGSTTITGVGFQPDALVFVGPGRGSFGTEQLDSNQMLGAAASSGQRAVLGVAADNGVSTSLTRHYAFGGECITGARANPDAVVYRADFSGFTTDGFTINWLEVHGTDTPGIAYLALKGGRYAVGSVLTETNTSAAITASGLGFRPSAVAFFSAASTQSAQDVGTAPDEWSIGAAASSGERGAHATLSLNASTAGGECRTAVEHDAVYINQSSAANVGLMDIDSFDADGFTCIMDDADTAQNFVWWLAVGDTAQTVNLSPAKIPIIAVNTAKTHVRIDMAVGLQPVAIPASAVQATVTVGLNAVAIPLIVPAASIPVQANAQPVAIPLAVPAASVSLTVNLEAVALRILLVGTGTTTDYSLNLTAVATALVVPALDAKTQQTITLSAVGVPLGAVALAQINWTVNAEAVALPVSVPSTVTHITVPITAVQVPIVAQPIAVTAPQAVSLSPARVIVLVPLISVVTAVANAQAVQIALVAPGFSFTQVVQDLDAPLAAAGDSRTSASMNTRTGVVVGTRTSAELD